MAKNKYILILFCFMIETATAKSISKYIIYFKDKSYNVNVKELFSQKALDKRTKFNIPFDERDYPVNTDYLLQLKQQQASILNTSNWLNAALVSIDQHKIKNIEALGFVSQIQQIEKAAKSGIAAAEESYNCQEINEEQGFEDNYTSSYPQVHLLKGEYLHEQGFNGEEMIIAVCDNGFYNYNSNAAFSHIVNENRFLGTYDYVQNDSIVSDNNNGKHGSNCLSFIGGLKANQYIGTASKSKFYLFQTEDNTRERLQEEFNLATALERCNQLGVDVVSISLGYNTFDVPSENHDTSDMRKNNTPAAKAVNMASSKGILVCVAAGNEGAKPWKYITTPSDADSAFVIASVNVNAVPANSSSEGLPNDPRVKPNVAAVGANSTYINTSGVIIPSGQGTSYATPQIAGLAACLWQAFPAKTNWEIKTAIEQSASQYLTPDKRIGYGIPDFQKAYTLLANPTFVSNKLIEDEFFVFPNPFQSAITISQKGNIAIQSITVFNNVGQTVYSNNTLIEAGLELSGLSSGMYLLQINTDKGVYIKKLIKD